MGFITKVKYNMRTVDFLFINGGMLSLLVIADMVVTNLMIKLGGEELNPLYHMFDIPIVDMVTITHIFAVLGILFFMFKFSEKDEEDIYSVNIIFTFAIIVYILALLSNAISSFFI